MMASAWNFRSLYADGSAKPCCDETLAMAPTSSRGGLVLASRPTASLYADGSAKPCCYVRTSGLFEWEQIPVFTSLDMYWMSSVSDVLRNSRTTCWSLWLEL